jgi:hypothetical protein
MADHSDALERRLTAAGRSISYPPTPELVPAVLSAIAVEPGPRPRRRMLAIAAAAAVIVIIVLGLPGPRRAVADLLGIGGVSITVVDELPDALILPGWGSQTTMEEARRAVDFEILLPRGLGEPDVVAIESGVPGGLVTISYGGTIDGSRLVLTQMLGAADPVIQKAVPGDAAIVAVDVGGEPGLWIEGPPHVVVVRTPGGDVREDAPRVAGNTLVFVRDGRTVRIELAGSLSDALAVAALLR